MSTKFQRIVIIGATSTIADHCVKLLLKDAPVELILVGRDSHKLQILIDDYMVRSPKSSIKSHTVDFLNSKEISDLTNLICGKSTIDLVLIAHGSLPDQLMAQKDLIYNTEQIQINAVSPVIFAESFVNSLDLNKASTIAIIGSVAGDRGRKSNYVYGSAKGLVARYAQGLQHRLARSSIKVSLIKPGPTLTPMTENLSSTKGFANVEDVAKDIVLGLQKGKLVIYTPGKWQIIMMIIRHLPTFIFNKLNI
jgi:short-subunit dehydrogenase